MASVLGAERPGLALADAVQTDVGAEHRRLQPAQVELRRRLLRAVDAADVRTVVRHAAHPPRKSAADRGGETFPVALRIAAPLDRIALAAGPAGAAPDHRHPIRLEFRRRLVDALVVQQRVDVVQTAAGIAVERDGVVGNLLAEVALDHVDAVGEQLGVRIAPPHVGAGVREIDDAAFGQGCGHLAEGAGAGRAVPGEDVRIQVGVGQQIAARREVDEQWRVNGHIGVFPDADPQVVRLDRIERGARIRKAIGIPFEIEAGLGLPGGAAVERQHIAGNLVRAEFRGHGRCLLRRLVVGARNPQAQAPQRDRRRASRELRVEIEDERGRVGREEEEVQRLVIDLQHVRAVRPFRVADAVRHARRRVDEHAPRALAGARAPRKRRVLVGLAGVDALRVDDLRVDQLPALVERPEFFAEAVYGFARRERQGRCPLPTLACAAERRQPCRAAKMLVGDRPCNRCAAMEQPEAQWRGREFERGVARRECPGAVLARFDGARLGAPDDKAIVGLRARPRAQPEHTRPVTGHFEDIACRGRKRHARCGRVEALQRIEAKDRRGVEGHGQRRVQVRVKFSRRTGARPVPARPPPWRRGRRKTAAAPARRPPASAAHW